MNIFDELPATWGSRGNPYFWEYLKDRIPEDMSADKIEQWIKEEHKNLTGQELTEESYIYVEQFAHGGMSSGMVYGEWWITTGIPLLKSRL